MENGDGQPFAKLALTGVVAYVDVWSSSRTENYSEAFTQKLLDMGAKVSKTFSKQVTHVIFKDGHWSTWNRAQKAGIKLVSVLWVEKCREVGAYVDESLYPARNTNEGLPQQIRKHKCMQPRDFVEKTPENDWRLQRKLKSMAKDLDVQKAAIDMDIPVLLFEDDGSLLYSPARKIKYECSAMERRIKDMKEKRENLSLTASQMSQVSGSSSVQATQEPVLASTSSTWVLAEEESDDPLNSSFTNLWGNPECKILKKESSKSSFEVSGTPDASTAALGSSPFFTDDCNHITPKQPSGKHLRKSLIHPKNLDRDLLSKSAGSEIPSPQKHNGRNDHLPQAKRLDCRGSSEKLIHLETAESSNNHSHSEMGTEHDTDFPSTNLTFSSLKSDCVFGTRQQQRPKRRSSFKPNTLALCRRESQDDFLKAVLTPIESSIDQDSSYEDYFSSFNLNKSKASLPLPILQKLQSPSGVVYKCSPSQSKQKTVLQNSSTKEKSMSSKREKMAENNENVSRSGCMQSVSLHSKETAALNYMLQGEKANTVKSPDCLLNLNIQQTMHTTFANRCHPTTEDENKFYICDDKDGSSEVLHNQEDEPNEKLKTRRIKKPLRTLVMTSMSFEQKNAVVQVGKKLGGFLFSNEVCENTSHVIAGSPRRTLNVLLGIARGCWIVSYEWVLWSLEYGHWISEEPYELSVDFPAAPICRVQHHLSSRECHQKLFSDQPVMLVSLSSQPPFEKLCELIQLCGGRVCKNLRQAGICIGKCKVGKHMEVQCLSEQWILDSVIQNKICPLESYIFQNKD
ncbi:PREDICTED: microcephalin [Gekko japonicus]|uniref:Microcephalin n=1 Tax=Gekko japonicus TaxID=146911 RepID=A0ABM1K8M8_GEKJA|nr:PREDICTED: microcephalin [Gekko japonicus]